MMKKCVLILSFFVLVITLDCSAQSRESKKFMFSPVISLKNTSLYGVPPLAVYLEKGIGTYVATGMTLGYANIDGGLAGTVHQAGIGARGSVFALPLVETITENDISIADYIDPYVGLQMGYTLLINEALTDANDFSVGVVVGTRVYLAGPFGFMAEYGMNALNEYAFTVGLTIGR